MKKLVCQNQTALSDFLSGQTYFGFFKIKKLIEGGEVKVNGVRTRGDILLQSGDRVVVYADDKPPEVVIVYQDDNVLFAQKPVATEVVGEKSLESLLRLTLDDGGITAVNRLDRNTVGIVCFAKNQKSCDELISCFKNRQVDKFYEALVYGVPTKKQAELKAFLFKDAKQSRVYVSDVKKQGCLPIETHYAVKEVYDGYCRLSVKLITGRTHQIRAHLAHIGHPVLGDGKYSSNEVNKRFGFKTQALCAAQYKFRLPADSFLGYLNDITIKMKVPF